MKRGKSNILDFINRSEVRWHIIIMLFSIFSTALIVIIGDNVETWIYFRQLVSIPFTFFFPGYVLVKNIYSVDELGSVEIIALSVTLSLIIVPSIGLLSNYVGLGITKNTQTYLILSFILIMSIVGIYKSDRFSY